MLTLIRERKFSLEMCASSHKNYRQFLAQNSNDGRWKKPISPVIQESWIDKQRDFLRFCCSGRSAGVGVGRQCRLNLTAMQHVRSLSSSIAPRTISRAPQSNCHFVRRSDVAVIIVDCFSLISSFLAVFSLCAHARLPSYTPSCTHNEQKATG